MAVLRASITIAVSLGILALSALGPSPSRTQTPSLDHFEGRFTHIRARQELRAMDTAINGVVDQMNIFIREIARGEVHRRVNPERRIELALLNPETMTLKMDDWGPVRVRVGASGRRVRGADGEEMNLTLHFADGRLVQRGSTDRGSRTNVFTLSPDRERLSMRVRIRSDQLPDDIQYQLTYRRID